MSLALRIIAVLFCLAPCAARAAEADAAGRAPAEAVRKAETDADPQTATLKIGFSRCAALNVNRNDLEAAFKVLIQVVGARRGYVITSDTKLYDDDEQFAAAVRADAIDVAIMDAWTFAAQDLGAWLTREFTAREEGKVGKQYALLTRRGSGRERLADLRGQEILLFEVANISLGRHWLATRLLLDRLGTPELFFSRVASVGKPSAAVLPVFFGNKPACIVDLEGFAVMKELNPQVGQQLQVVVSSDVLVDGYICMRRSAWNPPMLKEEVMQALTHLHEEPAGQQLLALVRARELVRVETGHLTGIEKLRATYERLRQEVRP